MRAALPTLQWYSGGTSYGAGGPVMARRNWSPGPNLAADQLLRDSTISPTMEEPMEARSDKGHHSSCFCD